MNLLTVRRDGRERRRNRLVHDETRLDAIFSFPALSLDRGADDPGSRINAHRESAGSTRSHEPGLRAFRRFDDCKIRRNDFVTSESIHHRDRFERLSSLIERPTEMEH